MTPPSQSDAVSAASGCAPGELWPRIVSRSHNAIALGVLHTIDTHRQFIMDGGVEFVVRVAASLARKDQDRRRRSTMAAGGGRSPDPFLPPEAELLVADLSATHFAVLNKFNVLDHHLLIVTRQFENQETLLNEDDFDALWRCLIEFDSLGFYNGGSVAGASQVHKHLQLVPLPLGRREAVPVSAVLNPSAPPGAVTHCARLPFRHAWTRLTVKPSARALSQLYRRLLIQTGIDTVARGGAEYQSMPYNLLLTRGWMLVVPRSTECVQGVSINALGFAGSLFVRTPGQAQALLDRGPMSVLTQVGVEA